MLRFADRDHRTVPKKWRTVLVNWGLREVILNGFKGPESDFGVVGVFWLDCKMH